jgi:hypothetical protein
VKLCPGQRHEIISGRGTFYQKQAASNLSLAAASPSLVQPQKKEIPYWRRHCGNGKTSHVIIAARPPADNNDEPRRTWRALLCGNVMRSALSGSLYEGYGWEGFEPLVHKSAGARNFKLGKLSRNCLEIVLIAPS